MLVSETGGMPQEASFADIFAKAARVFCSQTAAIAMPRFPAPEGIFYLFLQNCGRLSMEIFSELKNL